MIVPSRVRRRFDACSVHLDKVVETVKSTISTYCDKHGYAFIGRTKALESVAEKIETGRFKKWSDLDDFYGCAIVIPLLTEEDKVVNFLRDQFVLVEIKQRGSTQKAPDVFRFEATRFWGRLKPTALADPAEPRFAITFEIQIRSAFEHAWGVTTHAIYKSGKVSWKAKRLVAQLKAAVEQLDSLVLSFDEATRSIVEHEYQEIAIQRKIAERLSALADAGSIPETVVPKDWSRLAENIYSLLRKSSKCPRKHSEFSGFMLNALTSFESEIRALGNDGIPLSISLFQFAFGVLARDGYLDTLDGFFPLITEELKGFYPAVEAFSPYCFDFEK